MVKEEPRHVAAEGYRTVLREEPRNVAPKAYGTVLSQARLQARQLIPVATTNADARHFVSWSSSLASPT